MTLPAGDAPSREPARWFCGESAVSGVGSLPFVDVGEAVRFIAAHAPEVPFWPQLVRMSPREAMMPQTLGACFQYVSAVRGEHSYSVSHERLPRLLGALDRTEAAFDRPTAAGFYAFVDALARGEFPRARAVKGQVMGPVTVACSILVDGNSLFDVPAARGVVADYIVRLARWQLDMLSRHASSVVLVIDEAYLGVILRSDPTRRAAAVELLRSVVLRVRRPGVLVGLHCCDEIPFAALAEINPDLYSFDAHHGAEAFASDTEARRFVDGGGHVAWGWVPTLDNLGAFDADAAAQRWFDAAQSLASSGKTELARLRARSLVTASCGLAGSSEATCRRSFEIARAVAEAFAQRCQNE